MHSKAVAEPLCHFFYYVHSLGSFWFAYNERGFAAGGDLEFRLPNPVKPLKVDEFYLNRKAT